MARPPGPVPGLRVHGSLASHPAAEAFAREVHRVHGRYLREVVAAFALCPHVKPGGAASRGATDVPGEGEAAFGAFCVLLDREPDLEATLATALALSEPVAHLVFPLIALGPAPFERFAAAFGDRVRRERARRGDDVPTLAAFHPGLEGDASSPDRLIGLLRRAPDPFVQLVPEGLAQGGTVMAMIRPDGTPSLPTSDRGDHAHQNWRRLASGPIGALVARVEDIRADRDRSYAPYVEAIGAA